jgi:RNA-binding protein
MLNGKQRAYLRSLANGLDSILIVGKGGIDANILKQADDALAARELIKGSVLETSPVTPREAADRIAGGTGADTVQVIGSRFVLYRRNEKEPKIVLPKK